jgi:hypothetical protein
MSPVSLYLISSLTMRCSLVSESESSLHERRWIPANERRRLSSEVWYASKTADMPLSCRIRRAALQSALKHKAPLAGTSPLSFPLPSVADARFSQACSRYSLLSSTSATVVRGTSRKRSKSDS